MANGKDRPPETPVGGQGGGGSGQGGGDSKKKADRNFTEAPAAQTVLSLSQALLGPLDAISKAQIHSARSFLNFLMQIGFPHTEQKPEGGGQSPGAESSPTRPRDGSTEDGIPYVMDFFHDIDGKRQKISIPTLALVPVVPLGVSHAEFKFDFSVSEIARHQQMRAATEDNVDREYRPWFLVETPVSLQGTFAPSPPQEKSRDIQRSEEATFHIEVKVAAMPMPAALEKLLAGLAQITRMTEEPKK